MMDSGRHRIFDENSGRLAGTIDANGFITTDGGAVSGTSRSRPGFYRLFPGRPEFCPAPDAPAPTPPPARRGPAGPAWSCVVLRSPAGVVRFVIDFISSMCFYWPSTNPSLPTGKNRTIHTYDQGKCVEVSPGTKRRQVWVHINYHVAAVIPGPGEV